MKEIIMTVVSIIVVAILAYFLFLRPTDGLVDKGKGLVNKGTGAVTEITESLPSSIK